MPEYCAYLVGSDDHIQNAVHLNCADDDQAIILAKEFADGHDVELWHLGRAVAIGRDRIPSEVSRGQGAPSFLQGRSGGPMSWRVALMWGTVIVAIVLGVLAAAYFSFG